MAIHKFTIFAALVGLLAFSIDTAKAETVSVGGTDAWLYVPSNPKAGLILLPGAGGLSKTDPLQRATENYSIQGFAVLAVDSRTNIIPAMKYLSKIAKPVYLAAVSKGVSKVANMMKTGKLRTQGLVLVSGALKLLQRSAKGPKKLPRTLVIHHRDDACEKTPPGEVNNFKKWGGSKVTVHWLDGGSNRGNTCGPKSHHGLAGLDDQVVSAIADFLK